MSGEIAEGFHLKSVESERGVWGKRGVAWARPVILGLSWFIRVGQIAWSRSGMSNNDCGVVAYCKSSTTPHSRVVKPTTPDNAPVSRTAQKSGRPRW